MKDQLKLDWRRCVASQISIGRPLFGELEITSSPRRHFQVYPDPRQLRRPVSGTPPHPGAFPGRVLGRFGLAARVDGPNRSQMAWAEGQGGLGSVLVCPYHYRLCEINAHRDPMNFIGFSNAIQIIWFGDIHSPRPYKFIGLRWALISQTPVAQVCKSAQRPACTRCRDPGITPTSCEITIRATSLI
jgi:hypothetical protein